MVDDRTGNTAFIVLVVDVEDVTLDDEATEEEDRMDEDAVVLLF